MDIYDQDNSKEDPTKYWNYKSSVNTWKCSYTDVHRQPCIMNMCEQIAYGRGEITKPQQAPCISCKGHRDESKQFKKYNKELLHQIGLMKPVVSIAIKLSQSTTRNEYQDIMKEFVARVSEYQTAIAADVESS